MRALQGHHVEERDSSRPQIRWVRDLPPIHGPIARLKGPRKDAWGEEVPKELQIALAMQEGLANALTKGEQPTGKLQCIFPVLIGKRTQPTDDSYPGMPNFFSDGSNGQYVNAVSGPTTQGVVAFLESKGVFATAAVKERTLKQTKEGLN